MARPRGGTSLFAFVFFSIALLALSRLDHSLVRSARALLDEAVAPALSAAVVPLGPVQRAVRRVSLLFEVQDEVERLREENQRLKSWEARAKELERRMLQLDQLARVVEEPGLMFATTRVIADASGPFVRIALVDAGRDHGMKIGYPVISVDGLVGRLVATGRRSSRLLLLSDLNSRVPVQIGRDGTRAIMLGDNGPLPRIAHMPSNGRIEAGDDVFTSGVGGVFPRGLRVGTVVDMGDQFRIELNARLDQLEYVSVLFFDTPGRDIAEEERQADMVAQRRSLAHRNGQGGGGR
jgi:rod shape-determining protein MreC